MAAAGGSGVASAIVVLIIYAIKQGGYDVPDAVSGALSTILVALLTFAAGYYTPPGASEDTIVNENGNVVSAISPS